MRGGKFEVGIVSMLQTALNGRPGAMQFLREVCRVGGGRGEGCPLQTAQVDGLERRGGMRVGMGRLVGHGSTLQTALNGRPGAVRVVGEV